MQGAEQQGGEGIMPTRKKKTYSRGSTGSLASGDTIAVGSRSDNNVASSSVQFLIFSIFSLLSTM